MNIDDCPNCGWAFNSCHCVPKTPAQHGGRIAELIVFRNGSLAAIDQNGDQIPELQKKTLIEWFAVAAVSFGYSTNGCRFDTPFGKGVMFGQFQSLDKKQEEGK